MGKYRIVTEKITERVNMHFVVDDKGKEMYKSCAQSMAMIELAKLEKEDIYRDGLLPERRKPRTAIVAVDITGALRSYETYKRILAEEMYSAELEKSI